MGDHEALDAAFRATALNWLCPLLALADIREAFRGRGLSRYDATP